MIRALSSAATGMDAQQTKIDVIANNLANVNTTGFKQSRAQFEDLLYQTIRAPGGYESQNNEDPNGTQIGLGSRNVSTQRDFTTGTFQTTSNQLDVAIQGNGFFQIQQPNGQVAYTRAGNFSMNSTGQIVTSDGMPLDPPITIPTDATNFTIGTDGTVSAQVPNQTATVNVGTIQLATFVNPAGLSAQGQNLYVPTQASGVANVSKPGEQGRGTLMQGTLEMSNVSVVQEMVDLIAGQRAYDVNSKVVQTADQMLQGAANMKAT